jgi:hypothetical protein
MGRENDGFAGKQPPSPLLDSAKEAVFEASRGREGWVFEGRYPKFARFWVKIARLSNIIQNNYCKG